MTPRSSIPENAHPLFATRQAGRWPNVIGAHPPMVLCCLPRVGANRHSATTAVRWERAAAGIAYAIFVATDVAASWRGCRVCKVVNAKQTWHAYCLGIGRYMGAALCGT
jgi:hypothetical protein